MSDVSRVEEVFLAAIDQPDPDQRAKYLDGACGDDADLRRRVETLLAARPHAEGFLEPVDPGKTHDYIPPETQAIGTMIANRYSLVEVIGEGGMGTVWRAKQTEPVKRYVALKLIKPGMDSKQVLARFEAERQALAMMDHPNIARILDGGIHDNRPFFVMELVKGTPITEFCDARKLTPQQRLELFLPVCQAIQHAHQKGIIHRDIKPSNVLIALYDDKPVPKVIDFGVAKATGGALTQQTIDTGFGGVVGTPQYMSPEQATFNNLDIDTRSDVYSLGTLLYELLAGSPPFAQPELEKRGLLEILRVVREEEPPRPSLKLSTAEARASISANRSTEPLQLSSMMQGEIDWIVMKALEKDRSRRYDTATALAKDVQRYLTGDAVEACPPTLSYRMRKFLNKNRTAVRVASAFICLGAGAIAMGAFLAVQARRAEIEASQKRVEAVENAKRADEAASRAEHFRMLSDGRADRLNLELENSRTDAASLQIDLDLAELRDDAKVGLLRLSRNIQAIDTAATNRKEHLNSDLFDEKYAELVAQKKALSEFVTAAVLTTGQNYAPLLPPLTHDGGAVQTCELSSDARVVMTLGYDGTVRLWDSTTAQAVATLREQDELVLVCRFSPDGRTAITDDMFGVARIWDATTGCLRVKTVARPERYQHPSDWTYARIASAGRRVGWGSQNIQTENNRLLTTGATFEAPGDGEKFDRFEYSSLSDLWDTNTGKWIEKFDNQIRLVGGGKYVVVLEEESQAAIYSAEDGGLLKRLVCNSIDQIAASPSGRRIAIKTDVLRVWDTNTWTEYVPAAPTVTTSFYTGALSMLWDPAMQSVSKPQKGNWFSLTLLSDRTAATIGYDVDEIYNTIWNTGDSKPAIDDQTGRSGPDLACLDDGRLFDSQTWKRLIPPAGRKFHPDLVHFAGDQRFVVFTQSSSTLGLPAWIDTHTDKACPGSGSWHHRNGYGMVQAFVPHNWLSEPELGQVHIIPTSRLDISPALLELWAQVAVRGVLGPDGELLKWNEETWEQKRQELAATKPPYEDFPFPGHVATDKLHWLRAEYEAAEDDKEKLMLVNELLSRSEKIGDESEAVRWRTERAKYANELAPMSQEEKSP